MVELIDSVNKNLVRGLTHSHVHSTNTTEFPLGTGSVLGAWGIQMQT